MLDFSFGELIVIGAVALVALGPERLPKVARTIGQWLGKAQGYVSQVKADIDREVQLSEIRKLTEEARSAASSIESTVRSAAEDLRSEADRIRAQADLPANVQNAWLGGDPLPAFARRYRPRATIEDIARDLERVKRRLALPEGAAPGPRNKYAPRARLNRPRVRR